MQLAVRRPAPERNTAALLHNQFDRIMHAPNGLTKYLSGEARDLARQVVATRLRNAVFYLQDNNPWEAALQFSLSADCLQNAVHRPLRDRRVQIDDVMHGFLKEAVGHHTLAIELFRLGLKRIDLPREQRRLAEELKYTSRTLRFLYHHDQNYQNVETRNWLVELSSEAAVTFGRLGLHKDAFFEYAHCADTLLDGALAGESLQPAITAASHACIQAGFYRGGSDNEIAIHSSNLKLMLDIAAQFKTSAASSSSKQNIV